MMRRTTMLVLGVALSLAGCSNKAGGAKAGAPEAKPAATTQKTADDKPAAKPEAKAEAKPEAKPAETPKATAKKIECPTGTTPEVGEFSYCKDADGKKHGPFVQRSADGSKVLITGQYDKGKKVGKWVSGPDGADKTIEHWAAGKRNGEAIMLRKDGSKYRDMFYKDGKLDGPMTIYKSDGSVQVVMQYKDGKDVTK